MQGKPKTQAAGPATSSNASRPVPVAAPKAPVAAANTKPLPPTAEQYATLTAEQQRLQKEVAELKAKNEAFVNENIALKKTIADFKKDVEADIATLKKDLGTAKSVLPKRAWIGRK